MERIGITIAMAIRLMRWIRLVIFVDYVIDGATVAYDVYEFHKKRSFWNGAMLVGDVVLGVAPFVPAGIGPAVHGIKAGAKALKIGSKAGKIGVKAGKIGAKAGKARKANKVVKKLEGVYEFVASSGKKYVGQTCNWFRRKPQHLASKKLPKENLDTVRFTPVPGGKTAREIAEQKRINELGIKNLSNKRNPIGPKRQHLLPPE
jgi:hypothetical protein